MTCGYCAADTQNGEPHTLECQVFRHINSADEALADPYSATLAAINAALNFAIKENQNMSQAEYDRLRAIGLECEAADGDFHWAIP